MGSQTTFITDRFIQRTGLKRFKTSIHATGIGANDNGGTTRGFVKLTFQCDTIYNVHALALPTFSQTLSNSAIDRSQMYFLKKLPKLSDPLFHLPAKIDFTSWLRLSWTLQQQRVHGTNGDALFGLNTLFGWVIAGSIRDSRSYNAKTLDSLALQIDLDKSLQRFWQLETTFCFDTLTQ